MKKKDMVQCNVRLLPEQIEKLEFMSKALGISQGEWVGQLIDTVVVPDIWHPVFQTMITIKGNSHA